MAHKITLSFTFEGLNHVKARNKKAIIYIYGPRKTAFPKLSLLWYSVFLLAKIVDIEIHYFMFLSSNGDE